MTSDWQPSLLSEGELRVVREEGIKYAAAPAPIEVKALQQWQQRIQAFQEEVRSHPLAAQGSLFDAPANPADPDTLAPFDLPRQNTEFWRWKAEDGGVSALYFVFDDTWPILLYVGETVKSNQRWKGEHDCKRYLFSYVAAHRTHQLPVAVNIAFWPHAPEARRSRQQLESALIRKWRSPFNKENWTFWGTPFVQ